MKYVKHLLQILGLFIICDNICAQVPVYEEPHHKPVLENDYVRLLDVHINPHDTTLYHVHAAPSVIVLISNSIVGAQKSGEAPSSPSETIPGNTNFIDYGKNPITHRVFNAGDNVFHVMDIELVKTQASADSCNVLQQNNFQTTINENLARVYKFNVSANQSINIEKSSCAYLLICVNGEINASNKKIKTGEYIFFKPNNNIPLINNESNNATCVLLQLK